MDKKLICVMIIGIFLLAGVPTVSANETINLKLTTNASEEFRICAGKIYSYNDIIFEESPDFKDKPIMIPHGSSVTVYIEYEIVDYFSWILQVEKWYFEVKVFYNSFLKEGVKEIIEELGKDDSQNGTIDFTFTNEELKNGYNDIFYVDYYFKYQEIHVGEEEKYGGFRSGEVILQNQAPSTPSITGPHKLTQGNLGEFKTASTDPDDDSIEYGWDWDDDQLVDEWTDEYLSGDFCTISKGWNEVGDRSIRVKARDTYNNNDELESPWSEPFTVEIEEKSKQKGIMFHSLFQRLFSSKLFLLFS